MKWGLIDLDTSHPPSWAPILRELGHEIVALCDHGDIHPAGFADDFAGEHDVPRVCATVDEMVDLVDGAIIHSCGWDRHVARATPFVEAGKAVLIDKPLAGKPSDLAQIARWIESGARLTGGSSLRFCAEIEAFHAENNGEIATAVCGCGMDEFNYGIHAYAMLAAAIDEPAVSVQHLGRGAHHRVAVRFDGGRTGIVIVGDAATKWLPFYATLITEQGVERIDVDNTRIYRSLLEKVMPYLSGETEEPPLPVEQLLRPEQWAIAAHRSARLGGAVVAVDQIEDADGYDDEPFVAGYRAAKYPDT